jgi:uncharacterized membrane protein YvbJ
MKTCPKCWENYPDEAHACSKCKKHLVPGEGSQHKAHQSRTGKLIKQKLKRLAIQVGIIFLIIIAAIAGSIYLLYRKL